MDGNKEKIVVLTEEIALPEDNIADFEESYKYIGILKANGNNEESTRKAIMAKYLQRVKS